MNNRGGFTLIEVMVSVVIISSVILALLELISNNVHIFSVIDKKNKVNQYLSLIIANPKHGHENKKTTLYELVREFDLEFDLRRKLKAQNVEILYKTLQTIDTSDFSEDSSGENDTQLQGASMIFETGKTVIKFSDSSSSLFRIKLQ